MRHRNKLNPLGRDTQHRGALLSNLAVSLIEHKHLITTTAKAKALRRFIEPLLTRAKKDTTHNRRIIFSQLRQKKAVKTLFGEIAEKIAHRPGGYTRIIKMEGRAGDNAPMAFIELVDFSLQAADKPAATAAAQLSTRKRTRRGGGKKVAGPKPEARQAASARKPSAPTPTTPKTIPQKTGGS